MKTIFHRTSAVILISIFVLVQFVIFGTSKNTSKVAASDISNKPSFERIVEKMKTTDIRVLKLKAYFERKNSPFKEHAGAFVAAADKYNIDYRLVPAISGIESSFGQHIPEGSYNAYGWANAKYRFQNWDEGIFTVSEGIKKGYIDRGAVTVNQMSYIYTPPNSVHWAYSVNHFIEEIEGTPIPVEAYQNSTEVAYSR